MAVRIGRSKRLFVSIRSYTPLHVIRFWNPCSPKKIEYPSPPPPRPRPVFPVFDSRFHPPSDDARCETARVYLDHAATTPPDPEVAEAVARAARDAYANPESPHAAGRRARHLLEDARERVLASLGGRVTGRSRDRLVFTSGATEANHLGLRGSVAAAVGDGGILVTARDHSSLRRAARVIASPCRPLIEVPLSASGLPRRGDPTPHARLAATVTLVCGQTGSVERLDGLDLPGIVHCDATQAAGLMDIRFADWPLTTLVAAPHKFGGPRGIGCLLSRHGLQLEPLLPGTQEHGLRGGTEPVALAVGFALALERVVIRRLEIVARLRSLRDRFERELAANCGVLGLSTMVVAQEAERAPHLSTIAFFRDGSPADRQAVVMAADLAGICCSTGAACESGASQPAAALLAMGLSPAAAAAAVRFSFSHRTTDADLDLCLQRLPGVVDRCLPS